MNECISYPKSHFLFCSMFSVTQNASLSRLFPFTVAVLIQLIFIRSENPRNEHVTCVGRYADVIRLVCEHIFTNFVNHTFLHVDFVIVTKKL